MTRQDGISGERLSHLSKLRGDDFRLNGRPPAEGQFLLMRMRSGLILHATDLWETEDFTVEVTLRPAISFSLVLDGRLDATIGNRPLDHHGDNTHTEGVLMAIAEPDRLIRRAAPSRHVRKVSVSLEPEWLETSGVDGLGALDQFSHEHLATARWRPSARLRTLAEQVLAPPENTGLLRALHLEGRAIDLTIEAISVLTGTQPMTGPDPAASRKLRRVEEYLEANLASPLTLEAIARETGFSVTALQRAFRATHGQTVFDYVRGRRLDQARDALARGGASLDQAAFIAGYGSASNFATAFKRRYGMTPGEARRRGH